ncbi:MAG TPA: hypothetical protein VMR16_03240 [Candidatus Saccharimonadales bacterium]|nr:hypothetical protein [Candidatus Saccharimonadales bacterium]
MKRKYALQDFEVFKYKLPSGKADDYSASALKILNKIERLNPRLLKYFLKANTVLTLSGVRAFDTYLSYDDLSENELQTVTELLSNNGFTLLSNRSEYDSDEVKSFSLINHQALAKIPEQYKLEHWVAPNLPFTAERMTVWISEIESWLTKSMRDNVLPREWFDYRWPQIDIWFGVLLGYPGEAIASACWNSSPSLEVKNPSIIWADIKYHDAYHATWPVYELLKDIEENPNIVKHQKLWSDILAGVYESKWHQAYKESQA